MEVRIMAGESLAHTQVSPFPEAPTKKPKPKDNDGLHKRRGIWHYKVRIGGRWKEGSTGTRSYQDARKKRVEDLKAVEDGTLPSDLAKTNFTKAADLWLEGRRKLVAPKTYQTDRDRLKPLKAEFGNLQLRDITVDLVKAYQLRRLDSVGPRTINLEIKVLRMILKSARLWGKIADEYKPLAENRRGPGRALTPEQEEMLFKTASSNTRWELAFYAAMMAANTTMRGCEIKALRLADVDLLEGVIRIRRAATKTDAGCRVIPLNSQAAWAVTRLLERAKHLGVTEPKHFILPAFSYRHTKQGDAESGKGYDPTKPMKTWRTAWRSLTEKAGLAELRFHDLRHHCITKLAEKGVPEQTLMAIAGHVSKEMLEHYSHIRMQAKREAVAALEPRPPSCLEKRAQANTSTRLN
jgi:integrase